LKYTEETSRVVRSLPVRDCLLWQTGVDEPISGLNVIPFRQRFGCVHHQTYLPGGGMMGAILNRQQLLQNLETELKWRLYSPEQYDAYPDAFDALLEGKIIAHDRVLFKLLVGHWSMTQARSAGVIIPEQFEKAVNAWFPGGGTLFLAQPYAHFLDRY
jgi:hypothetical protein